MEIQKETALSLGKRIQSGELTAPQVVQAVFDSIKKNEPLYHCYVTTDEERAMEQAGRIQQQIEAGTLRGPLAGVPIAVKDNICTKGMRTTCSTLLVITKNESDSQIIVKSLRML